ncbi:lipoprotein lipase [Nephila pilipes]|uniref:Lipoprotein lipase n=1 Tax=Nephila pilipes TaxID=299642 RepID=A0A8X6UEG0_NEPPI|nr:lipoprotein lipase [Nephila pilipes]
MILVIDRKWCQHFQSHLRPVLLFCLSHIFLIAAESRGDKFGECSGFQNSMIEGPSEFFLNNFEYLVLPLHGKDPEIKFIFYSIREPESPQYITNANFSKWDIEKSGFDATSQTVFIMHGFREIGTLWPKRMKDALIAREKCNVIVVDYGQVECSYEEERIHLQNFGNDVAKFISNLVVSKNIQLQDIHLVGYSIGAHLAGLTGKAIKRKLKGLIGRITGLDPAGPNYYYADTTQRLDATDASFVDVIHTNAACSRLQGLGLLHSIGHFDFYVNGGTFQPGCKKIADHFFDWNVAAFDSSLRFMLGIIDENGRTSLNKFFSCGHARSFEVFIESIVNESCEFRAVECSNWELYLSGQCDDHDTVVMGYHADGYKTLVKDLSARKFFLKTKGYSPYCLS